MSDDHCYDEYRDELLDSLQTFLLVRFDALSLLHLDDEGVTRHVSGRVRWSYQF